MGAGHAVKREPCSPEPLLADGRRERETVKGEGEGRRDGEGAKKKEKGGGEGEKRQERRSRESKMVKKEKREGWSVCSFPCP